MGLRVSTAPRPRSLHVLPEVFEGEKIRPMLGLPHQHGLVLVVNVVVHGLRRRRGRPLLAAAALANGQRQMKGRTKVAERQPAPPS